MSSDTSTTPVSIRILDKDYRIACPAEEQDSLIKASIYLNEKMHESKNNSKLVGSERIAVMVALNITHELLQLREDGATLNDSTALQLKIQQLHDKVEHALFEGRQLEF